MNFPSCADFIFVLHDQAACAVQLTHRQTVVLSQLDLWVYPELGFTAGPIDVHVHSSLFAREEIETKATVPEDRRTHQQESYHFAREKPGSVKFGFFELPGSFDLRARPGKRQARSTGGESCPAGPRRLWRLVGRRIIPDRRYGDCVIAVPHQQCAHDFGNSARYAVSICSIWKPPCVMRDGMSRVT